jgi:hypothetical protein
MLKTTALPDNTRHLFETIRFDPALTDFTLIGGTVKDYFKYIFMTVLGKGSGDRVKG